MTEHDRVLDAFRNCITEPKCKDCPWTECSTMDNGNVEIPRDLALAVMRELVAQEPRVMTLDELRMNEVYWAEEEDILRPWPIAMHHIRNAGLLDGPVYQDYMGENYNTKEYGKTWRCWTSRPTDAQREAIPWMT